MGPVYTIIGILSSRYGHYTQPVNQVEHALDTVEIRALPRASVRCSVDSTVSLSSIAPGQEIDTTPAPTATPYWQLGLSYPPQSGILVQSRFGYGWACPYHLDVMLAMPAMYRDGKPMSGSGQLGA